MGSLTLSEIRRMNNSRKTNVMGHSHGDDTSHLLEEDFTILKEPGRKQQTILCYLTVGAYFAALGFTIDVLIQSPFNHNYGWDWRQATGMCFGSCYCLALSFAYTYFKRTLQLVGGQLGCRSKQGFLSTLIWMSLFKGIFSLTAALILWCFPDYWDQYAFFEVSIPKARVKNGFALSASQHTKYAIGFAVMATFFPLVAWSKMYVKRAIHTSREKHVAKWAGDFMGGSRKQTA